MKRFFIMTLAAVAASVSAYVYAGTPVSPSELPKPILTFISTHFPGDNIREAEKERGLRGAEYEVELISGAEIDFRDNGDWKEIKAARGKAVPSAIVPEAIARYVADNFEGRDIVEIARKRGGYEVELSDDTELRLTDNAKPMPARRKGSRR